MSKTRKKHQKTEYEEARSKHRSATDRYVVKYELNTTPEQLQELLNQAHTNAYIGRRVQAIMRKRLEQLNRRKDYKQTKQQYAITKQEQEKQENNDNTTDQEKEETEKELNHLAKQLQNIQEQEKITFTECRKIAQNYATLCGSSKVFALTRAEAVWDGVEKNLYTNATRLGRKSGTYDLPILQAKQTNRAIVIKNDNGTLTIDMKKKGLPKGSQYKKAIANLKPGSKEYKQWRATQTMHIKTQVPDNDTWLKEETQTILEMLENPEKEQEYINIFLETGEPQNTHRPCYASIKLERVRGRWRAFVLLTVEGRALPKRRKDGNPRHYLGSGRMGLDLGVSTYAVSTDGFVEMKNLAERDGRSSFASERKEALLSRRLDRSRRAMNPQYYDEQGRIKKGKKEWKCSNGYRRTREELYDCRRRNRVNREYAIREDVNRLREYADEVISEKQSVAGWAKKSKESKKRPDGRWASRKRFGRSVANRCPGAFRAEVKKKFVSYVEVDIMFRASQYDHERDVFVKKKLSQRSHYHSMGRASPRDAYSSFLLWCAGDEFLAPDRGLCSVRFDGWFSLVSDMVRFYRECGRSVLNSGF